MSKWAITSKNTNFHIINAESKKTLESLKGEEFGYIKNIKLPHKSKNDSEVFACK